MSAHQHNDLPAEEIARRLGGATRTGGGWTCKCPAHDDQKNSLSLTEKDGKLLWKCHAGCSQSAVMDGLAEQGLIAKRVNKDNATRAQAHTRKTEKPKKSNVVPLGKIVATYDYMDVTGTLLFQVIRFEPKTFRQRRPSGAGWDWGLGRVKPVLYRLPQILQSPTVFVVEGEKDADTLHEKFGICTSTSPMGAGKWRDEMGEALADKHVVILPDNDDPGRKHADDIAASAYNHGAASVRVVALPRLPEKGDPSDWLEAGGTLDELRKLVRQTPEWHKSTERGDPSWRSMLVQGDQGPQGNEFNALVALEKAPELAGKVRFDSFRTALQCRDMPWHRSHEWRDWTDNDDTRLAAWLQGHDINIPPIRVAGAVQAAGGDQEHHPVRDYLNGLKWDGSPRIDGWLFEFMSVTLREDRNQDAFARYVQAISRKWLISAVARIMSPGCKVDVCLIFESKQGTGKSSALRILGGEWFSDQISHVGNKDAAIDIRGKWIIELGELAAMGRAESETMKDFMSRQIDHYRPPFGRRSIDVPRQCVFAGSTNQGDYLKDETGNRRYWPVKVGAADLEGLAAARDQLWAEAFHRWKHGETWWLTPEEFEVAAVEQDDRLDVDPWQPLIENYVNGIGLHECEITTILQHCIEMKKENWNQQSKNRVGKCFRAMGWELGRSAHGSRPRVYRRPK